jgi:Tfp pilus assembly protein PilF
MAQQFRILFDIYRRPHAAFCRVLDEGKFLFALVVALITGILFFGPVFNTGVAAVLKIVAPPRFLNTGIEELSPISILVTRVAGGFSTLGGLISLAVFYVPATIVVVTLWDSLGGLATILRRDYLPLVTCHLLSYVAILLPCALLRGILAAPVVFVLPLLAIFAAYFLFLSATSLRAVMGTTMAHAAVATVSGCAAATLGSVLYGFIGSGAYILTSPFLLYYGYRFFQSDIQLIGSGLSSRQNLRRQLEVSKLNPRDWDAHLQIGLIQAQRRQFAEAEASFKRSIEIAPDEADAYFHLAKIMREQGRLEEAMKALRTAASLDEKLSSSEVWRDLGAVAVLADHPEEAQPALAKYVQRRPYDPEGLYWYGKVLKRLGQPAAAKEALEQSLEAVQTAPPHQRGRLRKWASEARAELKSL